MIHFVKTRLSGLAALAICGAAISAINADALTAAAGSYDRLIQLPEAAVEGELPNGLHYIILPNDMPDGRTEFRLVWRVGAVQQEENQGGCAHFLEHMAFGGSEKFPERSAVAYLESLGMKYGIDINAFTGHDRTIYMFATPSDSLRATGYARPLSIIRDWADRLTINPERVGTEKGIILEELRSSFQEDPFYDLKIGQNRFSRRMPLGTPDEVRAMTSATLSDYYGKWYVPQLATVVVVGDVDPEMTRQEIVRQFSSLPAKPDPGFRTYSLDYDPPVQIMLDTDSLNTREEAELIIPHPTVVTRTIGDARLKEAGNILVNALARRISDSGIRGDISNAWYLGATDHLVFTVRESDGMPLDSAITRMANVVKSALDHGFSADEIEYYARRAANRIGNMSHEGYSSAMWCEDFADYIISGDRHISRQEDASRLQEAVLTVTPEEISSLLREWIAASDTTMLVALRTTPAKAPSRTLDYVLPAWRVGLSSPSATYSFSAPEEKTLSAVPTPEALTEKPESRNGQIESKHLYPALDLHEYTLSNGMRLVVRPTTDDSTAMFAMVSPGGYSSVQPEQLPLIESAASYIDMGGIDGVPYDALSDYLYMNDMALSTAIENDWHGFLGAFDTSRTDEFLNLLYYKMTAPELRYDDFEEIRESMLEDVGRESVLSKMLSRASDRQLTARMDELMCSVLDTEQAYRGSANRDEMRRDFIGRMSLDSIADFYKNLYARRDGTVFIVCGNLDPDSLATRFAARLSGFGSDHNAPLRFSPLNLPVQTVTEQFPNENESQTEFDYVYFGKYEPNLRNSLVLKIMSNLLRNRIISELREHQALVYSPYVSLVYDGLPRGYYYFDINSSTDNANMPRVHEALRGVIEELRATPPTEAELDAIRKSCIIAKRETLTPQASPAWRTTLLSLVKNNESFADFNDYEKIIGSITPDEIREAFRKLIDPDLFVLLYMSREEVLGFRH